MGQVQCRLGQPLSAGMAYFVKHDRQKNRNRKKQHDLVQADNDRISKYLPEIRLADQPFKMVQPNKGASRYAQQRLEILKSDCDPIHGHISENNVI